MIVQNPDLGAQQKCYWVVISKNQVLRNRENEGLFLCNWEDMGFVSAYQEQIIQVGEQNNTPVMLIDTDNEQLNVPNTDYVNLRVLLFSLGFDWIGVLSRAMQVALFLRTHRFCGQCGSRMKNVNWELAVQCDTCSFRAYPRISPCIIVAIRDGDKILLAQGRNHKDGMYSTLAGFVESGERLEEAVHREVFEEVGVRVKNLEYFGSQPWPFPHSLMVGFIADYDGGDIVLEEDEILAADWFTEDALPKIPPALSIAGQMIDEVLTRIRHEREAVN